MRRCLLLLALGWEIPAKSQSQVATVAGVSPRSLQGLRSQTPMKLSPNIQLPQGLSQQVAVLAPPSPFGSKKHQGMSREG